MRIVDGLDAPQQGDRLVAWNTSSDGDAALVVLADVFDYFDPLTDYGVCSGRGDTDPCAYTGATAAVAARAAGYYPDDDDAHGTSAQEWTHANAATLSADGATYIVSLRHLSCVVAFRTDGGGVAWVLSGEGVRPSLAPNGSYTFFAYNAPASHQCVFAPRAVFFLLFFLSQNEPR